jgi:hypothetical protein
MPPNHTLIIKANITSSLAKNSNQKIDKHLRHQIITTCGDANAMMGTNHIDPALCLYLGAYLMCIDNKHLRDKVPRENGTLCQVLDVKLKNSAPSYKCKNYYGRKVWTVNATYVEWVECEHVNKTGQMLQLETQINDCTIQLDLATKEGQPQKHQLQSNLDKLTIRLSTEMSNQEFKLKPEQCSPKISVKCYSTSSKKVEFHCKMKQIPANCNDATTGHKLQGMSKDVIVVTSWPTGGLAAMFKNWEYVVLSRVCTLSGLLLVEPIDMEKSFKPSAEIKKYIENARRKETDLLENQKCSIAQLNWL